MSTKAQFSLKVPDKAAMYAIYMPFVNGSGIFIPTTETFELQSEVTVEIELEELKSHYVLTGPVVWITPADAQSNRKQGIGIKLEGEEGQRLHRQIETYLAGMIDSYKINHTM